MPVLHAQSPWFSQTELEAEQACPDLERTCTAFRALNACYVGSSGHAYPTHGHTCCAAVKDAFGVRPAAESPPTAAWQPTASSTVLSTLILFRNMQADVMRTLQRCC
jgi:hypothetical protein